MSERRPADEMTDPGPPPEDALDATLRALGEPVPVPARRTAESAGLSAAYYHGEPRRPPKAHEPPRVSNVITTEAVAASTSTLAGNDTLRMRARDPEPAPIVAGLGRSPSRLALGGGLAFVVLLVGVAIWALSRDGAPSTGSSVLPSGSGTASARAAASIATTPSALASASQSAPLAPPGPSSSSVAAPSISAPSASAMTADDQPSHAPRSPVPARSARVGAGAAPASPRASTTTTTPPPAPTTKYNRFLEEDKK